MTADLGEHVRRRSGRGRSSRTAVGAFVGVGAVLALVCASTVLGLTHGLPALQAVDNSYQGIDEYTADHLGAYWYGVDPRAIDLFSRNVRSDDRFFFEGGNAGVYVGAARLYTGYWLAPATPVASPGDATVVVAYNANPRSLPLHYASIVSLPGDPRYAVARIAP